MRNVIAGRKLVLHGVHAPRALFAQGNGAVDGVAGGPHQVGPGGVIVRRAQGNGPKVDACFQNGLGHSVLQIARLAARKIRLQRVAHNVRRAGRRLVCGHGEGVGRVQHAGHGAHGRVGNAALFACLPVGNNGHVVHLRAGGRKRQHAEHRQHLRHRGLAFNQVPRGAAVKAGRRHHLGAVDGAAAAHGQHAAQAVLAAQRGAPVHRGGAGVGLYPGQLHIRNARLAQRALHLGQQARALDRAAAIAQ